MSGLIDIKVPDIGDFKDVPVIEVFVKPGDKVKAEDPLVSLESDKATMEVPSPRDGVVKSVHVEAGQQAVTSQVDRDLGRENVHIGPSDYVAWLDDRKWAYVRLEGRAFGDVPLNLEYKLEVWDSPNSAGVIIDALRAAKIAKDRGIGGPILSASSYFMKSPPEQYADAGMIGPPIPRSLAILAARTASMIIPAELGESHTSSLYSRFSGTSPNARPSSRT